MNWIIILIVSAAAVCVGCVLVFRMDLSEFGFLIIGGASVFIVSLVLCLTMWIAVPQEIDRFERQCDYLATHEAASQVEYAARRLPRMYARAEIGRRFDIQMGGDANTGRGSVESNRREATVRAPKREAIPNILGLLYEARIAGRAGGRRPKWND